MVHVPYFFVQGSQQSEEPHARLNVWESAPCHAARTAKPSQSPMIWPSNRGWACWKVAVWLVTLPGCATPPYRYGHLSDPHVDGGAPSNVAIEHGTPNKTLDRIGAVVGFPARILPMNSKINDHHVSAETEEKVVNFLKKNDLTDVTVFINHYGPKDQWRRLRDNKRIGAPWRYTMGSMSIIGYTLLPGRIFGGDRYNPFTNSLYLNSDVPVIALREAAYAKDVHNHKHPGTYAVGQEVPFVGIWSDSRAVRDVIGYARAEEDWELEQQAYHVLFPQLGAESTSIGGAFVSSIWWGGPALGAGGAAVGHLAGRTMAKREAAKHKDLESPADEPAAETQQAGYVDDKSREFSNEDLQVIRLPPP